MSSVSTTTDSATLSSTLVSLTTSDAVVVSTSATTSAFSVETTPTTAAVTTTTLAPYTSVVTAEPSTSYAPAPTTNEPVATTIITQVTSIVTQSATNGGQTQGPIITTITRTQPVVTYTPPVSTPSTTSSSSAAASQSALNPSGHSSGSSNSGLTNGATIAIAVIIPILAIVGFVLFGLWFWRRRKAKRNAEEERKNDMAEYGFNPNNDPTLPVGVAAYTDGGSEGNDDSGYRGWGNTSASANRKPSTTLGSNSRAAMGQGMSDAGSQPGGYNPQPSPSAGGASDDPLVHGYDGAAAAGVIGGAGVAGAVAGGARSRHSGVSGIHRGISNASSAYSAGPAGSEVSYDAHEMPRPYYQEEVPYNVYNEAPIANGPYTDGAYGGPGDEPVIRDVQARRNTRIERAPTFPQQGGIAQNF